MKARSVPQRSPRSRIPEGPTRTCFCLEVRTEDPNTAILSDNKGVGFGIWVSGMGIAQEKGQKNRENEGQSHDRAASNASTSLHTLYLLDFVVYCTLQKT